MVIWAGQGAAMIIAHMVVIVKDNELVQPKVPREGSRLAGDALLQTAIAANDISVVVYNGESGLHCKKRQQ